jgi:Uncharacterized membrane protein
MSRAKPAPSARPGLPRWRLLMTLLALGGFLIFLFPVFGGILNLANLAAMAGFLLLAAMFRWWPGFLRLLGRCWKRPWARVLLLVSGLGLATLLAVLLVLCGLVISKLRTKPETPCPTIIVLGCQVRGTTPSLLLRYRIQAAAEYLEAHPEAVAILSGGQGPGEDMSEAACMYQELTARGIDPARLRLEDASSVTLENLRFSMELMEREGLEGPVALISNDFHLYRALTMAEDLGLEAQGLAARSNWYSRPTYILREALALVKYALTG